MKSLSRVRLLVTPWTAAYQAPLSMGFSRQEYWSGVPLPSPSDMLDFFNLSNMTSMLLLEPKANAVPLPLAIYSLINASTHKVKV